MKCHEAHEVAENRISAAALPILGAGCVARYSCLVSARTESCFGQGTTAYRPAAR